MYRKSTVRALGIPVSGILLASLVSVAWATAGEVFKATFDTGTTGRGIGLNSHVTSGPPAVLDGIERGSLRNYWPQSSAEFGSYSAFWIDPASGLGGSAKGLHMVRNGDPEHDTYVYLLAEQPQNPSTKDNPYWIDYRFRWGTISSSTHGQFFVYSYQCSASAPCGQGALLWQTAMTAEKPTPTAAPTLSYYIIQGGPYPHAYLGDVQGAEYRVVMKIEPSQGKQTHWVFRNGLQLSDPILGKQWPLVPFGEDSEQTENVQAIQFSGHYDGADSSELNTDIDEIRISTDGPAFLKAYASAVGQINLAWTDNSANETGYRVERSLDGQTWSQIGSDLAADATSSTDTSVTEKTRYYYRVGALYAGDVVWSNTAYAVAIYTGGPLSDWVDVTDATKVDCGKCFNLQCPALGDGIADNTCALQQYLNLVNNSTHPDDPHVLYFPSGTYVISQTLFVANTEGAELVGESPPIIETNSQGPLEIVATGGAILKWDGRPGSKDPDTGQVSAAVMMRQINNHNLVVRNLVFDGGGNGEGHYVVGLDMSACDGDNTDEGDNQGISCDPSTLSNDWFTVPVVVGRSNIGSAVFDSVFQNAWIGFRISNKSFQDSDMSTRRSRFLNNDFGVSIEDFNALQIHFWDCQWHNNRARGITNYIKNFGGAPENWAGEFAIDRGRFSNNGHDIYYIPTGQFRVRDSWSKGSGMFIFGHGENGNVPQITISNNVVKDISPSRILDDYDSMENPPDEYPEVGVGLRRGRAIANLNPGPLVMFDNRFGLRKADDPWMMGECSEEAGPCDAAARAATAEPIYSYTGESGSTILALSNRYVAAVPYEQSNEVVGHLKLNAYDDLVSQTGLVLPDPPDLPEPDDILDGHKVFTVTDAGIAQDVIDAAVTAAQTSPVVIHFPRNKYFIDSTLAIPAVPNDLVVTGSGAATTLEWNGAGTGPMMTIGGYHSRATVRDLTFNATSADGLLRANGLVIDDVNAASTRVFMNAVWTVNPRPLPATVPFTGGIDVVRADLTKLDFFGHLNSGYLSYLLSHPIPPSQPEEATTYLPDYDDFMTRVTAGPQTQAKKNYWSGDCGGTTWCFLGVNGPQGLNLMISGVYMEHAKFYLDVSGSGGPGNVTVAEGKIVTSRTMDPSAVLVNDFPGNVSVISTWLFDFDPKPGFPPPSPIPTGALIQHVGDNPVTIESMGNLFYSDPGYDPDSNATFIRNSDKLHVCPNATYSYHGQELTMGECRTVEEIPGDPPTAELGEPTAGEHNVDFDDIGEFDDDIGGGENSPDLDALYDGLDQIRNTPVPGFYDEPGAQETYQVNVDNVKINHPITGILVNGGIPVDPSGLEADVISDTRIDLSWTDNSTNEDGFRVRRATSSGGTYSELTPTPGADVTSFSDTTVSEGNQYWYSVNAYRTTTGESGAVTTGPVLIALHAPTDLTATKDGPFSLHLSWTDNSTAETGFAVQRSSESSGSGYMSLDPAPPTSGTGPTDYDDTADLLDGTQYWYRVAATKAGVPNSSWAGPVTQTTPVANPMNLAGTPLNGRDNQLTWTDNSMTEQGFKVFRAPKASATAPCGTYAQIGTTGASSGQSGTVTYHNIGSGSTPPVANLYYCYKVKAYNGTDDSGFSNAVSMKTKP